MTGPRRGVHHAVPSPGDELVDDELSKNTENFDGQSPPFLYMTVRPFLPPCDSCTHEPGGVE
jgi:hypothetical protein